MLRKIFLMTTLYLLTNVVHAFCTKPLSVGFAEWPPYQFLMGKQYLGFDTEFIEMITKPNACAVYFINMPWDDQLLSISSGKLDLALGVSSTPERENMPILLIPIGKK
jgi:ABC-type amino acid transport substrate-binding protein